MHHETAVERFRRITSGTQVWTDAQRIPRHRHDQPYAALTLAGGYEECGTLGRYRVQAGHVLLHRSFDAHLDRFGAGGARILNLSLAVEPVFGLARISDPDAIARLAEKDLTAAAQALAEQLRVHPVPAADWPDLLARDLHADVRLRLADWAARHDLAPATVSRGFSRVFGVSPVRYRLEVRVQQALALIPAGLMQLAVVADAAGFADQAHMTRAVTALTGRPPSYWVRSAMRRSPAAAASRHLPMPPS
jgi:AraC-like DNA-binding protein